MCGKRKCVSRKEKRIERSGGRVGRKKGMSSSIHGLRAEFHPSKVEIRVRVPVDALFWSVEATGCVREPQKSKRRAQQGSNLQPPDPKSGALPIAPCALHLVMSGEGG